MGFFDFLKGKSNPPPARAGGDKRIAGLGKVVADKRAQTYDRIEALHTLADMKSADAAAALLPRFKYGIDPSITDQEEKDVAFAGVVAAGKDALPHVIEFCEQADGRGWPLTWPLKVLREILDDEEYKDELIGLLGNFDTEYARNVDPKLQIILGLEELVHDDVRVAVEPFLEDVNETIRFHAVETTFKQNDERSMESLLKLLATEESVRVKNKIADGFTFRGWVIPETEANDVKKWLSDTSGYFLNDARKIEKSQVEDY